MFNSAPEFLCECLVPKILKYREWIGLIVVMIMAAGLRFGQLDSAEFVWDQAHMSLRAVEMARTGQIAWAGVQSSVDADAFMTTTWLLSIPYAISLDPLIATGFVALLNTLSVLAGYFLARRWFGALAAFIAMLLYAVSPWAIEFSRKIWAGDPMPLFIVLYVASGWLAFVRGKRWALIAHALVAAWIAQLHFSGLPVILISAAWLIAFRKRVDWRVVVSGALLAALTFAPYFIVDAQQGWRNVNAFRALAGRPSQIDLESAQAAWRISTGSNFAALAGPDLAPQVEAASPNARFLFPIEGVLIALGLIGAAWIIVQRRPWSVGFDDRSATAFILVSWMLIPILFHLRHASGIAPTYLLITYPVHYILIGLLIVQVRRKEYQIGLFVLIAAIAIAQSIEVISVYNYISANNTPNGYGTSIRSIRHAGDIARMLSDEMSGAEIIVLGEGDDPNSYEIPRTADLMFYGRAHRSANVFNTLVLPSHPAVIFAPSGRGNGVRVLEKLTDELFHLRMPTREGGVPYRFYQWDGVARLPDRVKALNVAPQWSNGVSLQGYFIDGEARAGETMRWVLVWHIGADVDMTKTYHWFNHLIDADGMLVAQADGAAYRSEYWQNGDTVLTWFDLALPGDLPSGEYRMRVGMYEYPELINVRLTDEGEFALISIEVRN